MDRGGDPIMKSGHRGVLKDKERDTRCRSSGRWDVFFWTEARKTKKERGGGIWERGRGRKVEDIPN